MPWCANEGPRPSLSSRVSSEWLCMSIKPGATNNPTASISVLPRPFTVPVLTMRSSITARSPTKPGCPLPSNRVPPRITRSYSGSCSQLVSRTSSSAASVTRPGNSEKTRVRYFEAIQNLLCRGNAGVRLPENSVTSDLIRGQSAMDGAREENATTTWMWEIEQSMEQLSRMAAFYGGSESR